MSIIESTATEAPAQPPRKPRHRRTWVRLTALAVAALVVAGGGTYAALASGHHLAPHRPAAAARPAVPTPDQVLTRDGYTPMGSMTKAELIAQAPGDTGQILQPLVNGTSSVGTKGNAAEIVIPITPAGRTVLDNPAMLRQMAASSGGPGSAARFAGPYLVITDPSGN